MKSVQYVAEIGANGVRHAFPYWTLRWKLPRRNFYIKREECSMRRGNIGMCSSQSRRVNSWPHRYEAGAQNSSLNLLCLCSSQSRQANSWPHRYEAGALRSSLKLLCYVQYACRMQAVLLHLNIKNITNINAGVFRFLEPRQSEIIHTFMWLPSSMISEVQLHLQWAVGCSSIVTKSAALHIVAGPYQAVRRQ
jgi:hypothetical protein